MMRLQPVQLGQPGPDTLANNPPERAGAEPLNGPTETEDVSGEAECRTGYALIATLIAEMAAAYRNFDTIVRRLGYDRDRAK